jgi:hypothetical protein
MENNEDSPNPPFRIRAPQGSTLEELKAWHAHNNTLHSFLVDIGWFYSHPAPGDREVERRKSDDRGR